MLLHKAVASLIRSSISYLYDASSNPQTKKDLLVTLTQKQPNQSNDLQYASYNLDDQQSAHTVLVDDDDDDDEEDLPPPSKTQKPGDEPVRRKSQKSKTKKYVQLQDRVAHHFRSHRYTVNTYIQFFRQLHSHKI